jgi:hypothetical protein
MYEQLTENPELKALESQLQEVKYQAETIQAQLKPLSAVERMKRSQEKRTTQQQVHTIQSRVMEVTQRLQPVQDEAYQLFTEIEGEERNWSKLSLQLNNASKDLSMKQSYKSSLNRRL